MSVELVHLGNSDVEKFGRRYTAAEKETAYQLWRLAAGRSCRKVAIRLKIAERTLLGWRNDEGWIARADAEDHEEFASSKHGVAALVVTELVPNIETARSIRDNPDNDPRVRLAALQWLSGLAGVSPVSKIEQAVIQAPQQSTTVDVSSLTGKSPDELMREETRYREAKR